MIVKAMLSGREGVEKRKEEDCRTAVEACETAEDVAIEVDGKQSRI